LVTMSATPLPSALPAPLRAAPRRACRPVSLSLGLARGLPLGIVAAHLFIPGGEAWAHLTATVLPGYVWTTLQLAAVVGIGVFVIGVGTAWLVATCEFPGRRAFEWTLLLPLAVPAYVLAYAYTDLLQFSGPVQS